MAALTVWTQPLAAVLPGATAAQLEEKLRHAAKEFYLQSRAWRTVLGPFTVTAANPAVTLTPPADARVMWVRAAWLQEGTVVTALVPSPCKITESRSERPRQYYFDPPTGVLQLWPTPDATLSNVLYAEVALAPTTAAAAFPDLAESHHFEAIEHGALARLFAMPNKPWTNQDEARRYARMFRRACIEMRAVSDQGYTHSDPPWRFPPFA